MKTLSTDERSADILFRLYRRFRFTSIGDEPAFSSLRRAGEHEALLSLSATAAGVRTPKLVAVGRIGDEDDSMLLAQRTIDGRPLDSFGPEELAATKLLLDSDVAEPIRTEIAQTAGHSMPPLDKIKRLRPAPSSDSLNPHEGATQ